MFNQFKVSWEMKEAWQQTRQTLHRWVHITMAGYGLVQLLGYLNTSKVHALCQHSPWRIDNPTTAGQIRKGLLMVFHHVNVRAWWNGKCKKFEPPTWRGSEDVESNTINTAKTETIGHSGDWNQPGRRRLDSLLRSKL